MKFQEKFECAQEGEDRLSKVTWDKGILQYHYQEAMKNGSARFDPILAHQETLPEAREALQSR